MQSKRSCKAPGAKTLPPAPGVSRCMASFLIFCLFVCFPPVFFTLRRWNTTSPCKTEVMNWGILPSLFLLLMSLNRAGLEIAMKMETAVWHPAATAKSWVAESFLQHRWGPISYWFVRLSLIYRTKSRYRTQDRFSDGGRATCAHTRDGAPRAGALFECLMVWMHVSMDTLWFPPLHQNHTSSVLNVKGRGDGVHLAVSRWLKLIWINSFTNQNQQFMYFGRWKQQKSVFKSRAGWTLSHLAQTCLQCITNPLLSCLH